LNTQSDNLASPDSSALTPSEAVPPAQPSTMRKIFIGKDGLRAGWSLLIFFAMVAALLACATFIAHKVHPHNPNAPAVAEMSLKGTLINETIPFLIVLLVTWIMSKIERRPNSVYGLGGDRKLSHLFAGLGWGVVCLSFLVLILWKTGLLVVDRRLLFGGAVFGYGALWLLGGMAIALTEEYLTRGYMQYTLSRGLAGIYQWLFKTSNSATLGFWTSALVFSILFGLGHSSNTGESPIGLLSAGLAGLVFCFSLWRTGSLWWAIGFHASWDWAQSFLYGVADSGTMVQHHLLATHPVGKPILSGGATGPEGSIFIVAVLAIVTVIIVATLHRPHYGYPPVRYTPFQPGEAVTEGNQAGSMLKPAQS
jgi:membrane protease YdiL (CAAX protease family)